VVTIEPAERALVEGRFDEIDTLAAEADATPLVRLMKARADGVRGRFDTALAILQELAAAEPLGDARLELGLMLDRAGRRSDALPHWQAILTAPLPDRSPPRLLRLGRALVALGQARRANGIFQEAAAASPNDPRIPTAWGELFLDKHNPKEAADLFGLALKADDRWVPAMLGLARARAEDDQPAARAAIAHALEIDAASLEAHLLLAEFALDDRKLDEARAEIDKALLVNDRDIQALGMRAAIAFIEDRRDEAERIAGEAVSVNARAGDVYRVMGAQAASHYRFEDAVMLLQKAAALDPESPRIQAELGMHLLRTGDEAAARVALDSAFKRDPYDVVTYNLLSMLDTLDKFETITDKELVVKLHADEVPVMRESILALAREAMAAMAPRYGFTPRGPVLIEMFPKHDDFAVRTLGLPGMTGALGACFGRVVTLDSPRARPPGTFNWGATLWHEMAHVFALQLSAQRVPRWVTEGASVFEERRANPAWGREGEHHFLEAYARGELIPLADLNSGFSSARTINLAYHQASLVVEHLVGRFGDAGLQKLLQAFSTGQTPEAALEATFGLSMPQLQTSFDAYLAERFGQARTALAPLEDEPEAPAGTDPVAAAVARADRHPGHYGVQVEAGRDLLDGGRLDEARRVLERAAGLVPQTMGDESPRTALAEIAVKQGEPARARAELVKVLAEGHTAINAARRLLALGTEARDAQAARRPGSVRRGGPGGARTAGHRP
jgi:tetratricopeptide (TPR) repeat protein